MSRSFISLPSLGLFAALVLFRVEAEEAKEPQQKEPVQELVKQLSAEAYETRQQATAKLWEIGQPALPALKEAMNSRHPELADRASKLALYIGAGVLPNSPEVVKQMVLTFSKSSREQKLSILRKLTEMGHWRQVLHLARMEKDPRTRQSMESFVRQNAAKAVRAEIAKGNFKTAEEILGIAGDGDGALIMRAWYYKHRGMLEEQLKSADKLPGEQGQRWRMALHRVDGNIAAARKEAEALKNDSLIHLFKMLQGDPMPWLQSRRAGQPMLAAIPDTASRLQLARLQGQDKKAAELVVRLTALARDAETSEQVALILAGNGYRSEALKVLDKLDPERAFFYYDNVDFPELALRALGIPKGASAPYLEWVRETTTTALDNEDEEEYMKVIQLAGFFARRGEHQHVRPVLKPLMDGLKADGSDEWYDNLYIMVAYDLGEEVLKLIEERGNEDGEADLAVRHLLRNLSRDLINHLWDSLKKRNGDKLGQAIHELGLLTGILADTKNELPALNAALLAGADPLRLRALHRVADLRCDLVTSLEIYQLLAKRDENLAARVPYKYADIYQWKKAEPAFAKMVQEDPTDLEALTFLYITRLKMNRDEKELRTLLDKLMLLSMGDGRALYTMAYRFNQVGLKEQAAELWLRIATIATTTDSYVNAAVNLLVSNPEYLLENSRWAQMASLTEVQLKNRFIGRSSSTTLRQMLSYQFTAEMARGMKLLKQGSRAHAIEKLDTAHQLIPGDGALADHFFPMLRKEKLGKTYERWVESSYRQIAKACEAYPKSHNTHNTAAWLLSRSVRKLDEAHRHATEALRHRPHQGAYLDTMAEIWFARGQRDKAVQWGDKALDSSLSRVQGVFRSYTNNVSNYQLLYQQRERFKHGELPNQ